MHTMTITLCADDERHQAVCVCGYHGLPWLDREIAEFQASQHLADAEAEAGQGCTCRDAASCCSWCMAYGPRDAPQRSPAGQETPLRPREVKLDLSDPDGTQTLVLDGFPTPHQVAVLGPNSGTSNRYALGRLRKGVQGWVAVEVLLHGIHPVPPPVHVTLRYVVPDARHRDADNFAGIAKPAIDGLVKAGILEGDNAARLTQRVEFVTRRGQRRLEVVLAPGTVTEEG